MTEKEKIALKQELKAHGIALIRQRIETSKLAMTQAQEAANSEEKSSAGDKYETGRAMGHLQKDMHARQLAEFVSQLGALHAVPADRISSHPGDGSLILTGNDKPENTCFFISVGLGKQTVGERSVVFLSPMAPLAKQLMGKKPGDRFAFNQQELSITDLF